MNKQRLFDQVDMETEQREKLATTIMRLRLDSGLALEDYLGKLGMEPEDYLSYEAGNDKISVTKYELLAQKAVKLRRELSKKPILEEVIVPTYSTKKEKQNRRGGFFRGNRL